MNTWRSCPTDWLIRERRRITVINHRFSKTLVIHRAALGDSILIWPFLRRLGLGEVTLITDGEKGRLAARFLAGLHQTVDIEAPLWNALWNPDGPGRDFVGVHPEVSRIESFVACKESVWERNARLVFPNARIAHHQTSPPVRVEAPEHQPPVRRNDSGPVVLHVGAGSAAKRWPVQRSVELAGMLADIVLLAGEVEREQFSEAEHTLYCNAGGRFCETLLELCDVIEAARLFIGFDSGPAHLAAQIGIPTVALFGPTDPAAWSPIGPDVRVIAPPTPSHMGWLTPAEVIRALQD